MDKDLTHSTIKDGKFYLGQYELAGLMRPAIRSYRFHNKNQNPKAIVIPYIAEVDGVKIEFEQPIKPEAGKAGS